MNIYREIFSLVPAVVWLVLGCVLVLVILVGAMYLLRLRREANRTYDMDEQRTRSEKWARPGDVQDLAGNPGEDSRRLPLGSLIGQRRRWLSRREDGWLLTPMGSSVCVLAPTTAGKTSRVLVRSVIMHRGPAAVFSVKPDLFYLTLKARSRRGPIYLWDPTESLGLGTVRWSILLGIESFDDATRAAWRLSESAATAANGTGGMSDKEFWKTLAEDMLAPLLFRAAKREYSLRDVVGWAANSSIHEQAVTADLEAIGNQHALTAWESFCATERRPKGSVIVTARQILKGWGTEAIEDAVNVVSGDPEALDLDEWLDRRGTLYVIAPETDQEVYRSVFATLAAAIVTTVQDRSHVRGRAISPRLLLCLDEAANIAPLRNLDHVASTGSSQGITLITVWQDLGQIRDIYGPERANVILAGHPTMLFMSGISDETTLTYLKTLLGPVAVRTFSASTDQTGRTTVSTNTTEVSLLPESSMRELQNDRALAIAGNRRPMMLRIPGWFEDDELRELIDPDIAAAYDRQWAEEEPDPDDETDGSLAAIAEGESRSGGRRRLQLLGGGRDERRSA